MKRFAIALTVVLSATYASQAQDVITVVVNDGLLTVSTNGIDTNGGGPTVDWVGFDVASSTGSLIPYDPPQAPLHTPFLFFLSNTEHSIVMASVPAPATVLDDEIKIGYTGIDGSDLALSAGGVTSQFGISFEVVTPEPGAGTLAVFATLGLLGQRRNCRGMAPDA